LLPQSQLDDKACSNSSNHHDGSYSFPVSASPKQVSRWNYQSILIFQLVFQLANGGGRFGCSAHIRAPAPQSKNTDSQAIRYARQQVKFSIAVCL
jgi:hypothetical protein